MYLPTSAGRYFLVTHDIELKPVQQFLPPCHTGIPVFPGIVLCCTCCTSQPEKSDNLVSKFRSIKLVVWMYFGFEGEGSGRLMQDVAVICRLCKKTGVSKGLQHIGFSYTYMGQQAYPLQFQTGVIIINGSILTMVYTQYCELDSGNESCINA